MSLSARFSKINTGASGKSNVGGGSARRGVKSSAKSPSKGTNAKALAQKKASANKRADLMLAKRMGTKPKSLKEAAKGKKGVAAKKKATIALGKKSKKEAGEVKSKKSTNSKVSDKKKKAMTKNKKKKTKVSEPKKSTEDLNMEMDNYFASKKAAPSEEAATA